MNRSFVTEHKQLTCLIYCFIAYCTLHLVMNSSCFPHWFFPTISPFDVFSGLISLWPVFANALSQSWCSTIKGRGYPMEDSNSRCDVEWGGLTTKTLSDVLESADNIWKVTVFELRQSQGRSWVFMSVSSCLIQEQCKRLSCIIENWKKRHKVNIVSQCKVLCISVMTNAWKRLKVFFTTLVNCRVKVMKQVCVTPVFVKVMKLQHCEL